ncbi:hypothetical protein [Allorhizobium undicola]|uniref:hypothetical protein n=1 Tax=Allorhizobium undicola TaxID=78527 RepID=UPI0004820E9C|nr:hypothetical protein [Allorhizobium undicola]
MYAAIPINGESVEAVGKDEDHIISNLGEEHQVHYQVRPWTDEDIIALGSSGWGPIDKTAKDHNEPYEIEIFEVPEGYRYGPDVATYFAELSEWPEPIKTITLYKAVPGDEGE